MHENQHAEWLRELYSVLSKNPYAEFGYTTSDDGVWLTYGAGKNDDLNLGFTHDSARTALFEHLQSLSK